MVSKADFHATTSALRSSALFSGLPPAVADQVLEATRVETYPAGRVLFRQDDKADCFFQVLNGWIKLERAKPNGKSTILGVFTRGQSFAEAVAIVDGDFPATAIAATDVTVIRVPSQPLREAILAQPELGFRIIGSTAQHLHNMILQIEQLKSQNGDERVAEFLLSLADCSEGAASIALPFDKQLIAGRLGIKPETLSRAFARLRDIGVEVSGAHVVIRDVKLLQHRLAEGEIRAT
ncbi:MAG: Crp/Fnr family transcriptional regulator [Xanthobacteraceae bacterium]|nr:MAG: Crp/Fnr family transcriptional regulator [Xanthobacteraceae bacterium]